MLFEITKLKFDSSQTLIPCYIGQKYLILINTNTMIKFPDTDSKITPFIQYF